MKPNTFNKNDGLAILAIVLYTALLVALPLVLEKTTFKWTFSEEGPFEQPSIVAWLFASALVFVRARPFNKTALAYALLFAVFAAREADLHKAFTAASFLKINYYKQTAAPLGEKIVAGLVAVAVILLIVHVGLLILRFLFLQQGWRTRGGAWLLFACVLMAAGKVLDRAPNVLAEDYGIHLSALAQMYTQAFEEGYEMMHPLLMAWAVWLGQGDGLFRRRERRIG